jgi:hypothetical protein
MLNLLKVVFLVYLMVMEITLPVKLARGNPY